MSQEIQVRPTAGEPQTDTQLQQYVTFSLGDEMVGVNILSVKEVTPMIATTPIHHSPPEVRGYVNIRGQIHLVLDLRHIMGLEPKDPDENSRIVIFKDTVGESFGVLIDKISDVIEVPANQVEKNLDLNMGDSKLNQGLIYGVCKLEKSLLVLLDAEQLMVEVA